MIIVTYVSWRWPPVGGNNQAWPRIKGRCKRFRKHEIAARGKERRPIAEFYRAAKPDFPQSQTFRKARLSAKPDFPQSQTFRKTGLAAKPDLQNRVRLAGYLWRLHADIAPTRDTAP
jgi:hypothetical protein